MRKVVASVRGTEFIQIIAAPAILNQDDCDEKDELILYFKPTWCNSSYLLKRPSAQ